MLKRKKREYIYMLRRNSMIIMTTIVVIAFLLNCIITGTYSQFNYSGLYSVDYNQTMCDNYRNWSRLERTNRSSSLERICNRGD